MVDNRSAGFFGIGGAFNFKSGDASGMANAMSDEKMGQGGEYFAQEEEEQQQNKSEFVDRSAQLKGSLDSLAILNAANIAQIKKEQEKKKKEENKKKKKKSKKNLGLLVDDYEKS